MSVTITKHKGKGSTKLKLEVGKYYKTYGGWKAIVIWEINYVCDMGLILDFEKNPRYYVIHRPNKENESGVITHRKSGKAASVFSIGEPPQFDKHHPADLKEEWAK